MKHTTSQKSFGLLLGSMTCLLGTSAFGQVATPDGTRNENGTLGANPRGGAILTPGVGELPSDNPQDALFNQAVDNYNAGKIPQAMQTLQNILKQQPDNVQAHKLLGFVYLRQNKFADAVPQLQAVLKKTPKDAQTRDNLGIAYLRLSKPADAAAQFKAAVALSSKDAIATQGLTQAQALVQAQTRPVSGSAAAAGTQKAVPDKPSAQTYADLGTSLLKAGKTGDAADAFSKAADLDPKNADLRLYAGGLYVQAGQNDKAIPAINQALTMNTKHVFEAHTMLGQLYAPTDRAKAINEFKLAAQAKSSDPAAWYNLGVLHAQAGDTADAKQDYRKVLDLKPADAALADHARQNLAALGPAN